MATCWAKANDTTTDSCEATEVPITSYSKSASNALSLSTLMLRAQLMREAIRPPATQCP
ncbi:hypothetical protein D3C81_2097710 [compost metagenome]